MSDKTAKSKFAISKEKAPLYALALVALALWFGVGILAPDPVEPAAPIDPNALAGANAPTDAFGQPLTSVDSSNVQVDPNAAAVPGVINDPANPTTAIDPNTGLPVVGGDPNVSPAPSEPAGVSYFSNCEKAWAAGVAPLSKNQPGYGLHLDPDNDGFACEEIM